ncbi:MAG: homoserine O-acetyltransferase [Spirochaetales bacterium]|nr:homoserine O-acetyltransferase [Spirochaetales bacterium]
MDSSARFVGIVEKKLFTFADPPDSLELESGEKLGPVTVAYETYGELSAERDNAVLIVHALSGDSHVAGVYAPDDRKPGWWDLMIGPGKPIDTRKYFVVCSNILGGCQGTTGPSSINPASGEPYALDFPVVTISDMVAVQKKLIEHLGIKRLLSVVGGSMGGMQALEWILRYPEVPRSAVVIASCAALTAQAIAFDAVGRSAITADPSFENGRYYSGGGRIAGLAVARMLGHITYLSPAGMRERFGRKRRASGDYAYEFKDEFEIESYLAHQGLRFLDRFDANSYLYITKAMDYFDAAGKYGEGSLEKALALIRARTLFVSFSSDWLFPPAQSRELAAALQRLGRDVTYLNIESSYGHDTFLLPCPELARAIGDFLATVKGGGGPC